jgi:serine/threonine-protein kinase
VLYEMLTGTEAYSGETTSDTLASVIRAEPEWPLLPANVPPRIRELLRRCLVKDPRQRLQAIGEARITIEEAIAGTPEKSAAPAGGAQEQPLRSRVLPWAVATIAIAVAAAISVLYWRASEPSPHQITSASLLLPEPLAGVFAANPGSPIALSPDGLRLVFAASPAGKSPQLYLRELDQQTASPVAGTENATEPFFSPDGQWIGFFADGKLRKVSVHGGPVSVLADAPIPHGGHWARDNTIVYAPNLGSGLMRISSTGGTPQTLTTPDPKQQELSHRWPQVLPGNDAVLFTIQLMTQTSYDEARIAVLSMKTGKWRTLLDGGSYARYVPSGHMVYVRAGTLMAVPFDLARLEATGPPAPVQEGVITTSATSGGAEYDISESGLLAFVPGSTHPPDRSLFWVDRQGVSKELPAPPNSYYTPRISPDGKLVAVMLMNGPQNIWIYDFGRNTLMRFTFGGSGAVPVWTPDGRTIIYRTRVPAFSICSKPVDGSGTEQILLGKDFDDPSSAPFSVSPDGKTLLFGRHNYTGFVGTYTLSLDGSGKIAPFLQSTFSQGQAQFSPDGRWVAYMSNESGRDEVYVQPYPGPGGKWMVSSEGGNYPQWARNGHEIFFRQEDRMMSVPVETQPTFKAGAPRLLFRAGGYLGNYLELGNYDVAPDGQHFLMIKEKEAPATAKELSLILNWTDELKHLVPAGR